MIAGPTIVVPEMEFWERLTDELDDEVREYTDPLDHLHWRDWLKRMFPDQVSKPFGEHHEEFWDWLWDIKPDENADEFVAAWPRKGGKTSSTQLGVVAAICRGVRRYCIYNCETQPQADDKIQNIAALLERDTVAAYYPQHAERAVNKYNTSLGWKRTRCRTKGGGIIDSLGLNVAQRGVIIEGQPPDMIVIDDVDGLYDSQKITKKKEGVIKRSVLGAGTAEAAVVVAQNLIIPNGVVSRLVKGKADYMVNRKVSGPLPAIRDMETKRVWSEKRGRHRDLIVSGTPVWAGFDLKQAQARIDRFGLPTFIAECQNEVDEQEGALWTRDLLNDTRAGEDDLPTDGAGKITFKRIAIGVDPSGGGDDIGIIVAALGANGHCYILDDGTQPGPKGPHNWGYQTIKLYDEYEADVIVAEKNFGGDLVESNIQVHSKNAPVKMVTASRGKVIRAEPVRSLYEQDLVHHVGAHSHLEAELTSWVPGETKESPNRLDALVWAVTELMLGKRVHTGGAGSKRIGGTYR